DSSVTGVQTCALPISLRWARDTKLGRFNDLAEARDGGAWISGTNGLAKLPGPVRRLTPASRWQEFPVDGIWPVQNLERPVEDDEIGRASCRERGEHSE